jgi:cell wall-associated NlpC family hydrolase
MTHSIRRHPSLSPALALGLALALAAGCTPNARVREPLVAPLADDTGVPGVQSAMLEPGYWVARLRAPDEVVLDAAAIAAQNNRVLDMDDSMYRVEALPDTLTRERVRGWIEGISTRPTSSRYDEGGQAVGADVLDAMVANLDLDAVPATQPTRFGLVVHRAALRSFPSDLRVFSKDDDHDIDRFQESALFPGTPVAIAHRSHDGAWLFVVSPRYAAWVAADAIAEGTRAQVFDYVARAASGRVITGAKVDTVHTFEAPRVSEVQLDMGARLPLLPVPAEPRVNGQHPYTSWIVDLPVREPDGRLAFSPALVQRNADTAPDYLALTRGNIVRQAFKFLGERYGWGHGYNGRDCSGFVSDVYQSMGVLLPRNTSDQSVSPALRRTALGKDATAAQRRAAVDALEVGDLIYIPGHVMMMLGRVDGRPYVIHDTNGGSLADGQGGLRSLHLNAVSVTPLEPLRFAADASYIDRITNIVHIRP